MKIIEFVPSYRDDLIFMILEAKNALGRVPGLNEDLLDIKANYFDKGDAFYIAIDERDRVAGSVGYHKEGDGAYLHRLFVKCTRKRRGIGSALLDTVEKRLRREGVKTLFVNLGEGEEWFESRLFYKKHGFVFLSENKMKKELA